MRLEHERFQAGLAQRGVSARVLLQIGDACDLEPDEVVGVVRHALRVGFGEADAHVCAEAEVPHRRHSTAVDESVSTLATLLREGSPCVVLTGAGISTESGIPDFRSPTGIWAAYDPMEYATIDAFRRDPAKVWEFYALRRDLLARVEPNAGHFALAELERHGLVQAVITPDGDGLDQRGRSPGRDGGDGSARAAGWPRRGPPGGPG